VPDSKPIAAPDSSSTVTCNRGKTPGTRVQHDRGFNRQNGGELPPLRWRVSQQGLTLHNLPGVLPLLQFKAGVFADEELKSANKACEDALGQALLADSADREIFTGFWQ